MNRTDEQIKTDIVNSICRDSRVDASDVKVEVDSGVAIIAGSVPNLLAKRAVYYDALYTNGVVRVVNQLTVFIPPTYTVPTDAEIKLNAETS